MGFLIFDFRNSFGKGPYTLLYPANRLLSYHAGRTPQAGDWKSLPPQHSRKFEMEADIIMLSGQRIRCKTQYVNQQIHGNWRHSTSADRIANAVSSIPLHHQPSSACANIPLLDRMASIRGQWQSLFWHHLARPAIYGSRVKTPLA